MSRKYSRSNKFDDEDREDVGRAVRLLNFLSRLDVPSCNKLFETLEAHMYDNFCSECESHISYCYCNRYNADWDGDVDTL